MSNRQYESGRDAGYAAGYRDATRAHTRGDDEQEPLTLEDVKLMSQDEINSRWDEVLPVLEADDAA
ncbi:MAG: hypothetical protein QOG15_2057 [Solirubrobacteraceae bacterium]|jgi:hypothetical protein|nr:hypothetical protein [Solirubrobacteraceae bacterium]